MKTKIFNCLTVVVAAGMLTIAPSALAQAKPQVTEAGVEHLTCVKDAQELTCKVDDRDGQLAAVDTTSPIVSSEQLGQISDALLGGLYFLLPAGLGLAIFLRDRQSELLSTQIERLEKLWSQDPQR